MQTAWHGTQAMRTCCVSLVMECSTSRPATSLCTSKNCRYSIISFVFLCAGTINLSSGLERNSWLNTSCLSSTYRAEFECCVNLLLIFRKMICRNVEKKSSLSCVLPGFCGGLHRVQDLLPARVRHVLGGRSSVSSHVPVPGEEDVQVSFVLFLSWAGVLRWW